MAVGAKGILKVNEKDQPSRSNFEMNPPGNGMVPFPQKECPPRVCVCVLCVVRFGWDKRPSKANQPF